MSDAAGEAAHRAERLVRWYPKTWRSRYGDEFTELLVAEISERPRSWRRSVDVAWSGSVARLTSAGLTSHALEPSLQVRASLASLACALGVFLAFGGAMWSQLTIGWQWSSPDTVATTTAVVIMSGAMLLFVSLALLAAIPIAWSVLGCVVRRQSQGLIRPSSIFFLGSALLVVGGRHFGNGWPGTGGHPWAHQGLVPGGMAAFTWASTLSVTSYWAHPSALLSFPPVEIAWMTVSPFAMVCLIVGAAKAVRRLDLAPGVLRYERWLGRVAALCMLAFLAGSYGWIVDGGSGPRSLFHAGAIDVAGLVVMTVASAVAQRAVRQARRAGPALLER